MLGKTLLFLALFGGATAVIACAPAEDAPTCATGGYVFCRCANRAKGTKQCLDGHRFAECKVEGRIACAGGEIPDPETGVPVADGSGGTVRSAGGGGSEDAGSGAPVCGNGTIEPGEACDDPKDPSRCERCRTVNGTSSAGATCPGDPVHVWGTPITVDVDTDSLANTVPSFTTCADTPGNDFVVQVVPHKTGTLTVSWSSRAARAGTGGLPTVAVTASCPVAGAPVKASACKTSTFADLSSPVTDGKPVFLIFDAADKDADINVVATLQIR